MAANRPLDWRSSGRRLYLTAAIIFPLLVLIGFGPTYYFKSIAGTPALPSILVHIHGLIMTAWVILFVAQVTLIRTKNAKVHMKMGVVGVVLAVLIVVVGFFTAAAAAKYGSASKPPGIDPLSFLSVPFFDLICFVGLFGAAVYYRKKFATHKRLMLLTAINFLPPALGRIQTTAMQALRPIVFLGIPAAVIVGAFIYDWWHNGKVNRPFLIGGILLILSYPFRMIIMGTAPWLAFADWITTWAA